MELLAELSQEPEPVKFSARYIEVFTRKNEAKEIDFSAYFHI